MDHIVVVVFENHSLDSMLGHLYGPEDGKTFEGVIGKNLSNPIPEWAEDGADRKVVPYTVATTMDSPNPDSGEEYPHTNTQLYNILNEANRFKALSDITAPYNAPAPGQTPTMDGFVTDYISFFTAEMGRQPTYEEYAQIMTGFTPEQVPVLNGLARGFGVFDHWFCEVPSQTLPNRSFWTAATSSGYTWNTPAKKFITEQQGRDDLQPARRPRQDVEGLRQPPSPASWQGVIHFQRLRDRFATHFVPFSQFEDRRREWRPARLLVHRACVRCGPQRLPPRGGSGHGSRRGGARHGPAVVDPRRRGVPVTDLHRLSGDAGHDGLHGVEHDAAHRLGRAGWHV